MSVQVCNLNIVPNVSSIINNVDWGGGSPHRLRLIRSVSAVQMCIDVEVLTMSLQLCSLNIVPKLIINSIMS